MISTGAAEDVLLTLPTERFRPIRLLGRGQMGVVYAVHDSETDSEVALKTLPQHSPEQLYRLKQEFRSIADIAHPNLVELYELHVSESASFFTMELIDGVPLSHYLQRKRDRDAALALARQLAAGVTAIHAAGKLHRDLKPSNVLVTHDGRAVVLDFGLAISAGGTSGTREVAGTLAYMPPEYLLGHAADQAGDWYSLGLVLYEAFTGQLPFSTDPVRAFHEKSRKTPLVLAGRMPEAPPEVCRLVEMLLLPDPTARPDSGTIARMLQGSAPQAESNDVFVGRATELHALQGCLASRAPWVVEVIGPSGIGKSEMIRRFGALARSSGALVLSGRCYAQESVPYKALDELVDDLSRYLALQQHHFTPDSERQALLRLFPVLQRVEGFAVGGIGPANSEPLDLRRRGFAALRQLLGEISRDRQVFLWIDDLQWGDLDSIAALRELMRPPDAPPLLLVLSYRSEDRDRSPVLAELEGIVAELPAEGRKRISLAPLGVNDVEELMQRLTGAPATAGGRVAAMMTEAGGSPFLLNQLARSVREGTTESMELGDILRLRLDHLADAAQLLLATISVAGEPIPRRLALSACGMGERARPVLRGLEKRCLLKATSANAEAAVEIYHDRIREALLASLSADVIQQRHGALADVLESFPAAEPEAVFRHCLGAGRKERAADWGGRAAERADEALAFAHAAELYAQVLELRPDHPEVESRRLRLAEALANAGRSSDSADAFLIAADTLQTSGAGKSEVLELRRRAGEQYLRAGRVDTGAATIRAVLKEVGVEYPDSPGKALMAALGLRVRLIRRGFAYQARPPEEIPADMRLRINACWSTFKVMALVDQGVTEVLAMRHLLDALEAGDPIHIAHGLGMEATKSRQLGGKFFHRRAVRLLGEMEQLLQNCREPYQQAYVQVVRGTSAFEAGLWREASEHCDRGTKQLREQCRGVSWEIITSEAFALTSLVQMGQLGEMSRRLQALLSDADDRGDLYAQFSLSNGFLNTAWLARDQPQRAREAADGTFARWPVSQSFDIQHYLHLIAATHTDLYFGGRAAFARLRTVWPRLRQALLLLMESPRVELRNLRGRAALAAACAPGAESDRRWPAKRLLRLAAREAKRIAADVNIASALPFSLLLEAGVVDALGQRDKAIATYAHAADAAAAAEMHLYAAAARYRRGELQGGLDGRKQMEESEDWMSRQGIHNPAAMTRLWCPVRSPA